MASTARRAWSSSAARSVVAARRRPRRRSCWAGCDDPAAHHPTRYRVATMRLTILGTGSARPVGDSAQSGVLVESGDTAVLFDIGSGIAKQLEQRVGATNLAGLFVGHFHADHWIDIGPMRYKFPWAEDAPRTLTVFLPPGGRERLQ